MDYFSVVAATATGSYQFKINHSKTKDMSFGERITSPKFRVGQHDWAILYYPRGYKKNNNDKYVSVYLELQREFVDVTAAFEFYLLDKHGVPPSVALNVTSHTFASRDISRGFPEFIERAKFEETYVKDCYFVLAVQITVIDGSRTRWRTSSIGFLHERIQNFRDEEKCTDVTFDVDGKKFVAHRLILATHSPIFEAELFGPVTESNMDCIKINEMIPSVFKAMLDFMYNGSYSDSEKLTDCEGRMSSTAFLQHLLAAADRYAVDKLKATCEYKLSKHISLDTVLSTLEFAEKHTFIELKKDCLRFIVDKNNWVKFMFNEEYIKLMAKYPSLLAELKNWAGKMRFSADFRTRDK